MPSSWRTFAVEPMGGLVTNLSPLQHGVKAPSTARRLVNMEPSIEGGVRRINGYDKYDSNIVPVHGETKVQGSGQSGTTLLISNITEAPVDGAQFTIAGVTGTYTIASSGVTFSASANSATLTLTSSLDSSPADKAAITWVNDSTLIEAATYFEGKAIASRSGELWSSTGSGWTRFNVPSYGTVLVDGGSQTGTSLVVDGIASDSKAPKQGDTFTVSGIELVYTVTADATASSGAATLSITPALDSSPADNAALTFLTSDRSSAGRHDFETINFNGTKKLIGVDGTNYPFSYDGTNYNRLDTLSDLQGADWVAEYADHLFVANGSLLIHSVPFDETDWTPANGGGSIRFPDTIQGLIPFREQLIVFTETSIHRVVGTSFADFQKADITDDIGCVTGYSVQEVGGDVVFLAPDGLRFLSATERIGDFGFQLASRQIHKDFTEFYQDETFISSLVVRQKDQYRIFGYTEGRTAGTSRGYLGTQFADQEGRGFAWASLVGIKAYVADSVYYNAAEYVLFANDDGYMYRLEQGNSFDGANISAAYYTPFYTMEDPQVRKTMYTLTTYTDPEASVSGTINIKYDFNKRDTIQPISDTFEDTNAFAQYGQAVFGTDTYGGLPEGYFTNYLVGSGFSVSVEYEFNSTDAPFSIDAVVLEFDMNDRK